MKKVLLPTLAGLVLLAAATNALAAPSPDATCPSDSSGSGIAPSNTPRDLYVAPGSTCSIVPYSTVGRDVIVPQGSELFVFTDTTIGRDIRASDPTDIEVGDLSVKGASHRSKVGRDITINGAQAVVVCRADVGRDIVIANGGANFGSIPFVGDSDQCGDFGGNKVGRDLSVTNNPTGADVSDNTPSLGGSIGRDLTVLGDVFSFVESNSVGRDARCDPGQGTDGDGGPNTVGRNDVNCL